MADVFLSYARADRSRAEPIVRLLEAQDWSVWWDKRLKGGEQWDEVIETEIRAARCVLVVWTPASIASRWVKTEANYGLGRGILVPVVLDNARPPLAFSLTQAIDLTTWIEDTESDGSRHLISDVRAMLAASPADADEGVPAAVPSLQQIPNEFAYRDWQVIDNSTDPRDFRTFLSIHQFGLLAQRARNRLSDMADAAWSECRKDPNADRLRKFIQLHDDSAHAETARAMLASFDSEIRQQEELQQRAVKLKEAQDRARSFDLKFGLANDRETLLELMAQHGDKMGPITQRLRSLGYLEVPIGVPGSENTRWLAAASGEPVCDIPGGPEMVLVPPGVFQMGSKEGEGPPDELPQHEVRIPVAFLVGRFPVTFAQWDACHADGGVKTKVDDGGGGRGRKPVTKVSWDDAAAYVQWLSTKTAKIYRLLSEAEWEYCCRAGSTTAYSTGNGITRKQAQFKAESTLEVGTFASNPWGIFDMHGNVWEWTSDIYATNYDATPRDGTANSSGNSAFKAIRGGSYLLDAADIRSAVRHKYLPHVRLGDVGFRVARTL